MGSAAIKAPPTSGKETPTHEEVANDTTAVISILNLDQSISHLSTTTRKPVTVEQGVGNLLDMCPCMTPNQVINNTAPTHHSHDKVHKSIMRFVREPDRWTALASVLFKSMAYHRSVGRLPSTIEKSVDDSDFDWFNEGHSASSDTFEILPIVDLPRTKYNRPYLPNPTSNSNNSENFDDAEGENEGNAKISVSHQYPHIAIIQSSSQQKIGIDLVVFKHHQNAYTPSTTEFLKAFQQSFTPYEWERIHYTNNAAKRSEEEALREFFCRWAMKEAYTKALGLGMHVEFSSFETRLDGVDAVYSKDGIWGSILNATELTNGTKAGSLSQLCICGHVVRDPSQTAKQSSYSCNESETWEFIFVPIQDKENYPNYDSCACVCKGPLSERATGNSTAVLIEHVELLDLIKMHIRAKR
jgi:phosphopantetheine--protein transferase-like protein